MTEAIVTSSTSTRAREVRSGIWIELVTIACMLVCLLFLSTLSPRIQITHA